MRYREKLGIIVMRDNGPRRSFHLRRSNFFLLLVFFGCLPFLCMLLLIQCWLLWQENIKLRESMERYESEYQAVESRAERLENLEELLREENVPGRQIITRQLAGPIRETKAGAEPVSNGETPESTGEAAPADEFPAIDTGRVKVGNVQARVMRGNTLRIGLDLRNPDNEPLLSGQVEASLITADGERRALEFTPREVGSFRISRFKRTVMNSRIPVSTDLVNSQIILEVKDQHDKPIYRNIFAVQH